MCVHVCESKGLYITLNCKSEIIIVIACSSFCTLTTDVCESHFTSMCMCESCLCINLCLCICVWPSVVSMDSMYMGEYLLVALLMYTASVVSFRLLFLFIILIEFCGIKLYVENFWTVWARKLIFHLTSQHWKHCSICILAWNFEDIIATKLS